MIMRGLIQPKFEENAKDDEDLEKPVPLRKNQ